MLSPQPCRLPGLREFLAVKCERVPPVYREEVIRGVEAWLRKATDWWTHLEARDTAAVFEDTLQFIEHDNGRDTTIP